MSSTSSSPTNNKFEALQAMGAGEFAHLNGSLIAHLSSTYELLKSWGANTVLCDAGFLETKHVQLMARQGLTSICSR